MRTLTVSVLLGAAALAVALAPNASASDVEPECWSTLDWPPSHIHCGTNVLFVECTTRLGETNGAACALGGEDVACAQVIWGVDLGVVRVGGNNSCTAGVWVRTDGISVQE